ncbi:MAG TPA: epoxide hydrolase [Candidatus Limnocylindrales bacterium]|nr:epoxide hydrolase [Candidatus Limnocylindrales bacterium]
MSSDIHPFRVDIPQAQLDDLADRLARTRFTDEIPGVGYDYGVPLAYVQPLHEYWRDGYDWRYWESKLNEYPQFTTEIDGQNIHFMHIRSTKPDALPLILTHGWPMSIVEYLDVIEPLSEDFHLVIPSIPGFAFSGPTRERGWNRYRIARAWAELMRRLGYERFGAHGNDGGSLISPEVGRIAPESVAGVHVTQVFSFPSGDPAEFASLSEEDMGRVKFLEGFWKTTGAFHAFQSAVPQNVAHALADSPVGQLAWSGQLFGDAVTKDFALTNVTIYWLTGTGGSSVRLYYEDAHATPPVEPTTAPLGLANFKNDFQSIRPFAERDHKNIVSWNLYDVGGHYAAHEVPDVLAADIKEFFSQMA